MTVLLFGIVDGDRRAPAAAGLGGAPLRMIRAAGLAAVISDADAPIRAELETMRAYDAAVTTLMDGGPVLPARFNSVIDDEAEVARMLGERRQELHAGLDRVRGAVEFFVHPSGPAATSPEAAPPRSGTAYMDRLRERHRSGRELVAQIETSAGDLVRACRPRPGGKVAVLVTRTHTREFARRIAAEHLLLSGPSAPYSFVGADE